MRKLLSILAASTMIFSLVACTGSTPTSGAQKPAAETSTEASTTTKGETINLQMTMAWWGNQVRNERTQAALELYSQKNPGITFDLQPSEWGDYWTKLATASAGQTLPDVIQMDYKYLSQYVSNNLLVDLTPYIEDGTLDVSHIDEAVLKSGSIGDGIYAIPAGINAPALIYNKTLLDDVGITVKDNMTLTEFIDLCQEVYEKTGVRSDIAYNAGEQFAEYIMRSDGYVLFEEDKLGVPNAETLEPFFEIYENGINEGWMIEPGVYAEITIGSVETHPLVYYSSPATQSWCALYYSNQLGAFVGPSESKGFELGIATWPAENPSNANYLKPSQFFSVSVNAKDTAAAVKVVDFLTNDIECNNILLGERGVPVNSEVAAAIAPQLPESGKVVIKYINDVVTPNSSKINPASPEATSEVLRVINQLQEKIIYRQMIAKEAAKELFEEGNAILGR